MTDLIADNNPNNAWGKHVIEVVLKQWQYEKTIVVRVGGNCHGFTVLETAAGIIYDNLLDTQDTAELILTRADGNELSCTDDEDRGEDWIKQMIVSCRIIGYEPPTLNEIRKKNGAKPVKDGDKPYVALGSE